MAENKNTVKAETAVPEVKVGIEKVALFKKHLEDAKNQRVRYSGF